MPNFLYISPAAKLLKTIAFALVLFSPQASAQGKYCCRTSFINKAQFYVQGCLDKARGAWSHVELGAANYGENLVFHKTDRGIRFSLPNPELQYKLLFDTVDALIKDKGETGTFYLNDLKQADVQLSAKYLREYIRQFHPKASIQVIELPGDYFKINLPWVDSMHLKNPENDVIFNLFSAAYDDRLVYLSSQSSSGLMVQTMFHEFPCFKNFENIEVSKTELLGPCENYLFPCGEVVDGKSYRRFVFEKL